MKKEFLILKEEFSAKCKSAKACTGEFKKVLAATNEEELLKVIYDNLDWCITYKVIDHEFFSRFAQETYLLSGIANTGKENTGFTNSGYRNSGDWNSGYRNSGDSNSGNRNSGDSNSGNRNSGNWNSGDRNSGDSNSGYRNSGDSNSGNWNSGDRNSGDSNSGYRNSGAFCTNPNPTLVLFDKQTNIPIKEWEQTEVCKLMYSINPTIWVPMSIMSDEEKAAHPKYKTTEGYLKTIPMKEAWANFWGNLKDDKKKLFTYLQGFDAQKFEEITGIKIK